MATELAAMWAIQPDYNDFFNHFKRRSSVPLPGIDQYIKIHNVRCMCRRGARLCNKPISNFNIDLLCTQLLNTEEKIPATVK